MTWIPTEYAQRHKAIPVLLANAKAQTVTMNYFKLFVIAGCASAAGLVLLVTLGFVMYRRGRNRRQARRSQLERMETAASILPLHKGEKFEAFPKRELWDGKRFSTTHQARGSLQRETTKEHRMQQALRRVDSGGHFSPKTLDRAVRESLDDWISPTGSLISLVLVDSKGESITRSESYDSISKRPLHRPGFSRNKSLANARSRPKGLLPSSRKAFGNLDEDAYGSIDWTGANPTVAESLNKVAVTRSAPNTAGPQAILDSPANGSSIFLASREGDKHAAPTTVDGDYMPMHVVSYHSSTGSEELLSPGEPAKPRRKSVEVLSEAEITDTSVSSRDASDQDSSSHDDSDAKDKPTGEEQEVDTESPYEIKF